MTDVQAGPLAQAPPFALFGEVGPEAWRWLHLEGRDQCPFLRDYLPGLTGDPLLEAQAVGSSGKEALAHGFEIYELFRRLNEQHGRALTPASRILDFGCGWGRVIRFFLRDVAPENLIGIDVNERRLAVSRETNRWCRFQRCDVFPPTELGTESFDLVYAFSVFSHLSEEAHLRWLEEFDRLLKPAGVLILTTFPRAFLPERSDGSPLPPHPPLEDLFGAYDQGKFCFRPLEGVPNPHYGDAFIPQHYVRTHWAKRFDVREYFEARGHWQNVIVCTRPG